MLDDTFGPALVATLPDRELPPQASVSNEPFSHGYGRILSEYRAAWAIIRQWAGHDAAVAAREAQIGAPEPRNVAL